VQGKAPKEFHAILTGSLEEYTPSYAIIKKWVAKFKRGYFSTCNAPCLGRYKILNSPEIIDQIHELILKDH
jgi:hypothetical protein